MIQNDDIDLDIDLELEPDAPSTVREKFPRVMKLLEDKSHDAFNNPEYYKTVLAGEGDISQKVHGILQKYLKTKDPKDRGVYRQQMIPAYWEFYGNVAKKATGRLPDPKKFLLRFGLLHPNFINDEHKALFSKVVDSNKFDQPIYYLDEWLKGVGIGQIRISTTDEVKTSKKKGSAKYQQMLEKARGKLEGAKTLVKSRDMEKLSLEASLQGHVANITEHFPLNEMPEISDCYTDAQKRAFYEIQEVLKSLIKIDRDQAVFLRDYKEAEQEVEDIEQKIEEEGEEVEVDLGAINTEMDTVRQMTKMTIGRQGNHYPILTSEYFRSRQQDLGTRENVINILTWIESIDQDAFCRVYRNNINRIVPYVVLIPSYGDYGMCWEPYDRYNRATSRGRIAVPMYAKNLQMAVLTAVADLRWQVAKEKASYYWMEEGITGHYFQWFQKNKLRGDLKDYFIQDYITWLTKESEGTQKLDKELRGTFWRYLPFTQHIKEKLKTRNFVYQELYQRDVNRSMSDGY